MLHQLYQKQVEAWKEDYCRKYHRAETLVAGHLSNGVVEPWSAEALLSSRHKDTIELLEAEIERKKQMKVNRLPLEGSDQVFWKMSGYNSAIDEDIAYLEGELRKLKNEI